MRGVCPALLAWIVACAAVAAAQPDFGLVRSRARVLPEPEVRTYVRGQFRYIETNAIPDHDFGPFPNRGNPNSVSAQSELYRLPVAPRPAASPVRIRLAPVGVAVNGIAFDPGAAEFWNGDFDSGWQYEALSGFIDLGMDASNAHVQPNGAYHYHGVPLPLVRKLGGVGRRMLLIGYGADGFPMYVTHAHATAGDPSSPLRKMRVSYRLRRGVRPDGPGGGFDGTFVEDWEYVPGLGDLDECNGRRGVTPEYPDGTYYYMLTEKFPFLPRMLRGEPDSSFLRGPGGRGMHVGPPGGPGHPEAGPHDFGHVATELIPTPPPVRPE